MKPSELKELAKKIVLNQTDQALLTDSLDQIIQAYENQYAVKESLESDLEKQKENIQQLQDVNMRFFTQLQATQPKEEVKEDKELTIEEISKLFL